MLNPYTPSPASLTSSAGPGIQVTTLAKVGAWLQLAPVFGLVLTVLGMMKAFSTLGADGVGDPAQLSGAIGEVLISTAIGFAVGLIGFVLLGIAILGQGCRARWVKVLFWLALLPALQGAMMLGMLLMSLLRGTAA
ncbi:MAG: MotA/TolQ/ExbB proton channel family protein [Verrucomicrobiota bacterium]